jgi:thioredoxin 2
MTTANAETTIVACPECGQRNRVPLGRSGPICGRCKADLPVPGGGTGHPIAVTDATYAAEVGASPVPVLLDCWAAWCGPCRAIAPSIERLAAEYAGRAKFCKLDVDANPRTGEMLGVRGIPALFFLVGGRVVDQLVGAHPYAAIARKLEQVLERSRSRSG